MRKTLTQRLEALEQRLEAQRPAVEHQCYPEAVSVEGLEAWLLPCQHGWMGTKGNRSEFPTGCANTAAADPAREKKDALRGAAKKFGGNFGGSTKN